MEAPGAKCSIKWCPIGPDGRLEYPPLELMREYEERRKRDEIERARIMVELPDNVIGLKQLRRKYDQGDVPRKKRRKKKPSIVVEPEQNVGFREADMPRTVEDQLDEMRQLYREEAKDRNRKAAYVHCPTAVVLTRSHVSAIGPYDRANLREAEKWILGKLRRRSDFRKRTRLLEGEVIKEYVLVSLIDRLLSDPPRRRQLPIPRPIFVIRAPVPWHQAKITASHFMEHNLFIDNAIHRCIRQIWDDRYCALKIIDEGEIGNLPVPALEIADRVQRLCAAARERLIGEWLAEVAELFLERKDAWSGLFEKSSDASTLLVEKYFASVNSLLSRHLRLIVVRTVEHLRDFFALYADGNFFTGDYQDLTFLRTPFMSLIVEPVVVNKELQCKPSVNEMRTVMSKCFNAIIQVASGIPGIQNLLFPEIQDKTFLFPVSRKMGDIRALVDGALEAIAANASGPKIYLRQYEPYFYLLDGTAEAELREFMGSEPPPFLRDYGAKIQGYDELRREIFLFRDRIPLNLVEVDCSRLNERLREVLLGLRGTVLDHFSGQIRTIHREVCASFDEIAERISAMPEATRDVVELYNYMVESRDSSMYSLRSQLAESSSYLVFLAECRSVLADEDIQLNSRALTWPRDMETVMELAGVRLGMRKEFVEGVLKERRKAFDAKIVEVRAKIEVFKRKDPPVVTMDEMVNSAHEIELISREMKEIEVEAEEINVEESLLDLEVSPYLSLPTMSSTVTTFDQLWHTVLEFHRSYERWMYGPFRDLDADEVREQTEAIWKVLYKLSRTLMEIPAARRIAEMTRGKVDKFKQFLGLLQSICNPGLKPRHWLKISEMAGVTISPQPNSSLSQMIEHGLLVYAPKLEEISSGASKEHTLESNLRHMQQDWLEVSFELSPYRDTGVSILAAVDDTQVLLDDHILKAQTMRGSPFVKPFEAEMQAWEEKLITMQDIIDQWLVCQATWMYLEPIFSSEDIMRQMPTEAKNFRIVDQTWRAIMEYVTKDMRVLRATDMPEMLGKFRECNALLEDIQKGLNDYLEKKRLFFPRFFFLSNDELLEILSETKDAQRVQPHLKKCFEGIQSLRFAKEDEIVGMLSEEEEYVPFSGKINPGDAKGLVEKWLAQIEDLMKASLRDIAQDSVIAYFTAKRVEWVVQWPGQIVLCASQIHWTSEVCESFEDRSTEAYLAKCSAQIDETVALVRGKLDPGARITLNALIVIDVHARDVLKLLVERRVSDVTDFNWIAQLRYYWLEGNVTVSMITTDVEYGFEYLGNSPRLVITPLTDRCYRTLMGALKLNLGGAPEGPAGTGKTETSKDLAKALAKQCVVFNCSEGLDYAAMSKFFKGLAQSGAWACFDEFNRIELEVLSVIAQQILSIQFSIAQRLERFMFEGTEIKLNPTCNVIITMNPGYAGRQELPDNLKVLFRTVAMMVPSYRQIGEITLYSYGFVDAEALADKIVHTYKLCSEQLSSQSHYDYGMRAVKTVLVAAGNLKLKYNNENESILVLRAIIDVNVPKFLSQDLPLFEGIYSDLFPGVKLPSPDRDELLHWIKVHLEKRNLQATPWYLDKIIQIYEMILVRHGLMIVGDTLSGKTQAYQALADALTDLSAVRGASIKEMRVAYRVINPKAITLGRMYGNFDPVSHEWSDGVLATTFREFAQSTSRERKWIIFDGPVDAIWIENMNTVLDDNKKLCLMSGEIIQMSQRMNMMFEPADLEHASPATVSRCGMIYMEPAQLGWPAFFESYRAKIADRLLPDQLEVFGDIIEWLVQPMFDFVKHRCRTFVEIGELHMFVTFTRLMDTLLEQESKVSTQWLQCTLLFSIVWGICSTLLSDSRALMDEFLRKILVGDDEDHPKPKSFKLTKQQLFPDRNTIFDWVYDKRNNGTWISWMDTMAQTPLPANAKMSELIVQTNDMSIQRYFLSLLLDNSVPLLFVGPTGTGKSTVVLNYMLSLNKDKYLQNVLNFSARTSAAQTQEIVMSKLDRRRKGVYGPTMGKKCVMFVDDLSMPQTETYGAQPPIELLRQWIDHGHWYDLKDTSMLQLVDIRFVAAMLPPGGASNKLTPRLTRHMVVIGIDSFDDSTMTRIFGTILEWHFARGFDASVTRLGKMILAATTEVYRKAIDTFLPIPSKSHYCFNLRDYTRVMSGVLLVPASRMKDPDKLVRLWIHEIYRVFHDRLVDEDDREQLFSMVKNATYEHLRQPLDKVLNHLLSQDSPAIGRAHMGDLLFGNFMEPDADPKIYDEILDFEDLKEKMEFYLSEYNSLSKTPMSLVLFRYAIEHVSRVSRVLQQDNGHALLVGVGGSGRSSCAKLAASMCDYALYTIEMTRSYGLSEWRDDLKNLLRRAGCDGKPTVFLLSDSQIKDESFLEDLSMLLNTGDVPNLYGSEDKAEILDKMAEVAREIQIKSQTPGRGTETSPMALYGIFSERVRKNVHAVVCMSPIGEAFRVRLRMFPSLINCCTIDWYTSWPEEALERVAERFLASLAIDNETKTKCVALCQHLHTSVSRASEDYFRSQHRRNYVTPTSYLELIKCLRKFHGQKVDGIRKQQTRYEVGLEKLDFAAGQVFIMQEELQALQPKLVKQSQLSDKLMIKIEQDTINVEAKKEVVAADEALANEAAAAAQAIKDDCESDLAEATPALEAALAALDTLKPADVTIVKSMKNPPPGVRLVLEAVCVLKGVKPDRVPDPNTGAMVEDYWPPSVRMLGDIKFLENLKEFDKDSIPAGNMRRIRDKFIKDRGFQPEVVKKVSTACEGLCKWVRAMEVYDRVIKVVAPKKAMLAEAEAELAAQMETLNSKRALLQEVSDKLQQLNDEFAECMREKKKLEDQIELCVQKLERAEKLLGGLGGEKTRWGETAVALGESLGNVIGDILLASGVVAYLGAFTVLYRDSLVRDWHEACQTAGVPCSPPPFALADVLGDPVLIRSWMIHGLPADKFSVENGIIVTAADRWPLMIDPQVQANKWIKSLERDNGLSVIKLSDPNYTRVIETSVQLGLPVLLENIMEEVDAILEPILLKNLFIQRGVLCIKFAENVLEYNQDFRFYMTTRLRNPHYLPELAVKVSLLNFTITPQGLQDQLLGIVVAKELPALEEKKNQLIVESANNKRILKEVEDKILEVLSSSEGNILEDETAIKILSSSKILSEDIRAKQEVAVETSMDIDRARDGYKPVSQHASTLFFCISELANIDPMYQYSLPWFVRLFTLVIEDKKQAKRTDRANFDLQLRIDTLNAMFTATMYRNVCRSLFEKHKLIFSLILCVGILRGKDDLEEEQWIFLLTGGVALDNPYPNPDPSWLSDKAWSEVARSSSLKGLEPLRSSFEDNIRAWKDYYDLTNPHESPLPEPFEGESRASLKRLVVLRCVRPDKLVPAIRNFIIEKMGQTFVEPPPFELQDSYDDSDNVTPLIFILSPGSDPMSSLFKFADDIGMSAKNLKSISLGQGQGPIAAEAINRALETGEWLVLQNCHLAESWMRELDRICDEVIVPASTHPKFRLWLTSYPSKAFPVSILQNAVKMTNEPPEGLRNNLLRSYASDPISDPAFFNGCHKLTEWRSLLFSLCLFHGVVQERRNFGALGWNISYEFNESDLRISLMQLQMFLNEYTEVPFEALLYLIGECNYGGRVTDDKDRRLLNSLLKRYISPEVVSQKDYAFSPSGIYHLPENTSYQGCMSYIRSLPLSQLPEVFGLHQNADITKDNRESMQLLSGALLAQSQLGGESEAEMSSESMVFELATEILQKMPKQFDCEAIEDKYPVLYENSMNTVLRQEVIRFNRLTGVIKGSLVNVKKAIKGQIVMSSDLEEIFNSMCVGRVPEAWAKKSYPTLKPLSSYINDLLQRIGFLQDWIDNNVPAVFWLSGFFFTQSFLTGVLQNYARKHTIPIDHLDFEFEITGYDSSEEIDAAPVHGVYVNGLYVQGARWNRETMELDESLPKIMFDTVPVIWLKPGIKADFVPAPVYHSPLYKTSERRGVLATTGHSSNFVMFVLLPSSLDQSHWIDRGVACLCQLDD
ncbi:dynein heavy chain 3, axonemal [Copidosoma floridanum]|uniref:dynein heavy chain 3, axonemal n=1 Tax=Copidosoma floridanum TaxID=29053 RepID=UPI0006C9D367|nr:dynein heavy chain 3, axonemal [Copidosoma floridanum]